MILMMQTLLAEAATDAPPLGAIIAIAVFVILFAVFIWAWVRKRKRGGGDSEERPATVEEKAAPPAADEKPSAPEPADEPEEEPAPEAPVSPTVVLGEARSLREGLQRTSREGFVARLGKLFQGRQVDASLVEEIEEVMLTSDVGVRTAQLLIDGMRDALSRKALADGRAVWKFLREQASSILAEADTATGPRPPAGDGPRVIMVIGVNGTGKTTSIGKLAARFSAEGERVLLAAGDTFRAAAAEQLEVWARRVQVDCHRGAAEADPASVVFDAISRAKQEGHTLVIADTAGRLHTQVDLMDELAKVHRVCGKAREGAPHEVLLVLDATTGQNAIQQAKIFRDAVDVTGIVLTKLDGTAKGGVVLGICEQHKIPIRWVGVGERLEDLRAFSPDEFVNALFPGN